MSVRVFFDFFFSFFIIGFWMSVLCPFFGFISFFLFLSVCIFVSRFSSTRIIVAT